ncbi:polynucleotide kinase [Vibrio phage D480]
MKVIVTVGVPASGKTTWAEQFCAKTGAVNVNRDDARQELFGPFKWGEYTFKKAQEELVTKVNKDKALLALSKGKSVVISDTNLNPEYRQVWKSIADQFDAEYEEKLFHINFDEAHKRDEAREMTVGKKILTNMLQNYHRMNRDLIIAHFKELLEKQWAMCDQLVVLSDIDGTVAEMHKGVKGKRSPFEWKRVGEDTPRKNVLYALDALAKDYAVWFMSGRDGSCEPETEAWLLEHAPFYTGLVMRAPSDSRPDWVIKLELMYDLALHGIKPLVMFDDRDQVVNTLREVGVEVWQVQPGNF